MKKHKFRLLKRAEKCMNGCHNGNRNEESGTVDHRKGREMKRCSLRGMDMKRYLVSRKTPRYAERRNRK